jgi:hypothetical protein
MPPTVLTEEIMTGNSVSSLAATPPAGNAMPACRNGFLFVLITAAAITATTTRQAMAAPPAAGDTYVYRVMNGYNNESRGQVSYRVDKAEADHIIMSVTADTPVLQHAPTEIDAPDGKWLRHALINRDQLVDYEFAPAYPSYEFPLDPGKQWSTRVNAINSATGKRNSVRIDAKVIGNERIRVPAGEFDTIKIQRAVYAGDADYHLSETTISEMDWYAPALGRSVRRASNSAYRDRSLGPRNQVIRGDWNVYELVSAPQPR